MKFRDSALAHTYLDGLDGIEIGASAHNPFNLTGRCLNVDYTADANTAFKQAEVRLADEAARVDVVADGATLPFPSGSLDYVLTSHVFEHFYDPIGVLEEWLRVLKPGGLIFAIIPHKERTFDAPRHRTMLWELVARHEHPDRAWPGYHGHYSVWVTADVVELCRHMGLQVLEVQDADDKVGNGFTVVIRKRGAGAPAPAEGYAGGRATPLERAAAPAHAGFLGPAGGAQVAGWVWDSRRPDTRVAVDLFDGEGFLATITADRFRPDLLEQDVGDGRHGFVFHVPDELRDGRTHQVRAAVSGTAVQLSNSPLPVQFTLPTPG